jgi:hypothetical protein
MKRCLIFTVLFCPLLQAQTWQRVGDSSTMPVQTWSSLLWYGGCVFTSTALPNALNDSLKGIWRSCDVTPSNSVPTTGWTKIFSSEGTGGFSRAGQMAINAGGDLVFDQRANGYIWVLRNPLSNSPTAVQTSLSGTVGVLSYGGNLYSITGNNSNVISRSGDGGYTWSTLRTFQAQNFSNFVQTQDGCHWLLEDASDTLKSCDGWATVSDVGLTPNSAAIILTQGGKVISADGDNYPRLWDGNRTWSHYDNGINGSHFFVPSALGQASNGLLFVCGSGRNSSNTSQRQGPYVFSSASEGAVWNDISAGLPAYNNVSSGFCVVAPDGYLYLGIRANDATPPGAIGSDSGLYRMLVSSPSQNCDYAVQPGGQAFTPAGGSGSVVITTSPGCPWAALGPDWVVFTSPADGSGNGTITYQVAPNSGDARSATLTVGGLTVNLEQESSVIPNLNVAATLSHFASAGTWDTLFTLVNTGTADAQARLSLFGGDGSPSQLPLIFPQQGAVRGPLLAASLDRTLAPHASVLIDTTGLASQAVQTGSAQLATTGTIGGYALLRLSGRGQEIAVPLATSMANAYVLPFDNANGTSLGVALSNTSVAPANVPVLIRDDTGVQIDSGSIALLGSGQSSFVLSSQFISTVNRRGTIEFDTPPGGQISAFGVRVTSSGMMTTVPVLSGVTTAGGSFPYVLSGAGWKSTIVLVNTGASAAQAHLRFFDVNGNPLTLPLTFPQSTTGTTSASVDRTLLDQATLVIESTSANATLQAGPAQLATDGNIGGFLILRYEPSGQEAAAPLASGVANSYLIAFDNTGGLATGVAVENVSAQAASVPVLIRDDTGAQIGSGSIAVAANGYSAFVLSTLFPGTANIRGTVEFDTPAGGQIQTLVIRSNPSSSFTALPVLTQ